nr:MAG TPA: Darcin specific protein, lipocalin, TRANSPORT [Caudoviricetes sp.]
MIQHVAPSGDPVFVSVSSHHQYHHIEYSAAFQRLNLCEKLTPTSLPMYLRWKQDCC